MVPADGGEANKGNRLQQAWAAQSATARDFWDNMDREGRMSIFGIAALMALSIGTVMLGT